MLRLPLTRKLILMGLLTSLLVLPVSAATATSTTDTSPAWSLDISQWVDQLTSLFPGAPQPEDAADPTDRSFAPDAESATPVLRMESDGDYIPQTDPDG